MKTKLPRPKESGVLVALPPDAVLMALDCSSTAIGWAVLKEGRFVGAGLAKSPAGWDSVRRIRANTERILQRMCGDETTHAVLEWQGPLRAARCRNANGLAVLGQAQGYLLAAIERELPHVEVGLIGERVWTKRKGRNVSKARRTQEVAAMIPEYREAIEGNPRLDVGGDIADAIGLAIFRLAVR